MRKILTCLCVTIMSIVGICLATFYFFGIAAEYKFNGLINTIAILTNQNVKITNYQRHWFSSDAVVAFDIDPHFLINWQGTQLEALVGAITSRSSLRTILIEAHVKHGPLLYTANGVKLFQALVDASVVLSAEQNALLQRTVAMAPLANAHILINMTGDGNIVINSSKFTYHGSHINALWKGFTWKMTFSRALDEFQSAFDFLGYEQNTSGLGIKLNNFKFVVNLNKIAGQLLPTYKLIILPFFQCQIENKSNVVVNNLRYESFLHKDEDKTLSSDVALQIDNVGLNDFHYRHTNFNWHAGKIDAKLFADLINATLQLQRAGKITSVQGAYFLELLLRMLNNNAILDINKFEVITPWGKLNVTANAVFKQRFSHASWLLSLLANSQAVINVRLEQGLALYLLEQYYKAKAGEASAWQLQARTSLQALLRDNKLLVANGFYSFSLNYMDNKLLLNNQPFSWVDEK